MKFNIHSNLVIILAVILFASCSKSNEGVEETPEPLTFTVSRFAAYGVLIEKMTISSSNTDYSIDFVIDRSVSLDRNKFETKVKTSAEEWENLINCFDLETFTKIKNGGCRACAGGVNESVTVVKDGVTYMFNNGVVCENYQHLQNFFDLIFEQAEKFRVVAGYQE